MNPHEMTTALPTFQGMASTALTPEAFEQRLRDQAKKRKAFLKMVAEELTEGVHYYYMSRYVKRTLAGKDVTVYDLKAPIKPMEKRTPYKGGSLLIGSHYECVPDFIEERATDEPGETVFDDEGKARRYHRMIYRYRCEWRHLWSEKILAKGHGTASLGETKFLRQIGYKTVDDLRDTIIKMAKKRAMTDGALYLPYASEVFQQDEESEEREPSVTAGTVEQTPPTAPPPSPLKATAQDTHFQAFLRLAEHLKAELGAKAYYQILGGVGVEHDNDLRTMEQQRTVALQWLDVLPADMRKPILVAHAAVLRALRLTK